MQTTAEQLADTIREMVPEGIISQILDGRSQRKNYTAYQTNPVGFCEKELKIALTEDVKGMLRSIVDHRVTIAISGNSVGKTHAAAAAAIWFKRCFPGSQVITSAAPPVENLKDKLWGELETQLFQHKALFPDDEWRHLQLNIREKSDPMSFIKGIALPATGTEQERIGKFSGSHRPFLLFILDEGDSIPDWVYLAIDSCMTGGLARLLSIFNPRFKAGAAYRMIEDPKSEASVVRLDVFNHPNVITGKNIIPGAVDRQTTLRRINEWTVPLERGDRESAPGVFKVPDFLVGEETFNDRGKLLYSALKGGLRKVTNAQFSFTVLGEYPPEGSNQLYSEVWIEAARTRYDLYVARYGNRPPREISPIQGLDVADEGGDYNVLLTRYGGLVMEPERWKGMDPAASGVRAAERYHELRGRMLCIDGNGVGAGSVGTANRSFRWGCLAENCSWEGQQTTNVLTECPKCKGDVKRFYTITTKVMTAESPTKKSEIGEFNKLRDQLAWQVREWLKNDQSSMLPPCRTLLQDLRVPTYDIINGKVKVMAKKDMRKALKRSPDDWDALCLTFAHEERSSFDLSVKWV